jgi:LacI family transcriptional regulator
MRSVGTSVSGSRGDHTYLRKELPQGLPLVAINRKIPGIPCSTVSSRHRDTAAAVHYLASRNERIGGIFGNFSNTPFLYRYRALRAEIARRGLPVQDRWFRAKENSVAYAREAIQEILGEPDPPTGLFVAGNRLTEGALLGLRDMGLRHGYDIDLVGFDLRYAELLDPPLPVLMQPARSAGEVAVRMLLDMIDGHPVPASRSLPLSFLDFAKADHMPKAR